MDHKHGVADHPSFVPNIIVAAKWNEGPALLSGVENTGIVQLQLKKDWGETA